MMNKIKTFHPAFYTKIVWIFLVSLTSFAFLLGWLGMVSQTLVGILLLTTFIKGHLVIEFFMELRNVKLKWRMIPTIWLLVVTSLISFAYYFPAA
ncbi:MAG: cytochrome C oxidase subunit IV family protein [Pseudomonadota bacterium]